MEKGLILAGSAAGFAAMFSAPLAGIIFAVEEMGRALEKQISSLVLTVIIFSGVTVYALLNSYIYFEDESLIMPLGQSWLAVPLCGIVGGFLGGLFSKTIILGSQFLTRTGLPIVIIAIVCGGVIAALVIFPMKLPRAPVFNKPRPYYTALNLWILLIRSLKCSLLAQLSLAAYPAVFLFRHLQRAPDLALIWRTGFQ